MGEDIVFELFVIIQTSLEIEADLGGEEILGVLGSCSFEPLVDLLPNI